MVGCTHILRPVSQAWLVITVASQEAMQEAESTGRNHRGKGYHRRLVSCRIPPGPGGSGLGWCLCSLVQAKIPAKTMIGQGWSWYWFHPLHTCSYLGR